jgi:hypothetical protein
VGSGGGGEEGCGEEEEGGAEGKTHLGSFRLEVWGDFSRGRGKG